MRPIRTITARLSGVFLSLLLPVILGLFSIASLRHFNGISSQVQERWLPSTRALGDLNNFTSDFRAAEAATLLAVDANELAARVQEMADLDRVVSKAQRDDSQISHDATEQALYARFSADWLEYRDIVRRVQTLSQTGGRAATVASYNTTSKQAYAAASDTLKPAHRPQRCQRRGGNRTGASGVPAGAMADHPHHAAVSSLLSSSPRYGSRFSTDDSLR